MKSDRMWFYPPETPGFVGGGLPTPQLFFRSRVFVWRPVGVWRYSLKCPRGDNCVGSGRNVHLSKSGYHSKVRLICDVSGWYTVITDVLSCGPCTKGGQEQRGCLSGPVACVG
ncbi:Tethering factor for nuclear proteasome sts1 [Dissostichus eleginoides]|uniref:Tethering factor for nuclear proteasome sts1 n=1 Tax=Dissostichus eleginoides TaxID=100907 RepID=A0AAD9C9I4_DISEL|nr:Tethering factor for nuclear proteasome sts1 [Dissostichus eleginoides]